MGVSTLFTEDRTDSIDVPFSYYEPKLLRHKAQHQVFLCDYDTFPNPTGGSNLSCILKLFSSRAQNSFKREVSAYTVIESNLIYSKPVAKKLWSGRWDASKYKEFVQVGNFPSVLRRSERNINVLMISFIKHGKELSRISLTEQSVRAAIKALQTLHSVGIAYGNISTSQVLVWRERERYEAKWVDLSSSIVGASQRVLSREWQSCLEYFSKLSKLSVDDITPSAAEEEEDEEEERDQLVTPISPGQSTAEFIEELPQIKDSVVFTDFEAISSGTHAIVYKVLVTDEVGKSKFCCLKIFRKHDDMTPYKLETTAYEYLRHSNVTYFVPHVYGSGSRTVIDWGLDEIDGEKEGVYYGILMEWLDGSEALSEQNVTGDHVRSLVNGLLRIHDAGVLHNDTYPRNMMVIPGSPRAVWIDFSCALVDLDEGLYADEMEAGGTIPIAVLCQKMENRKNREIYPSHILVSMNLCRRISAIAYFNWLLLEGVHAWMKYFSPLRYEFEHPLSLYLVTCAFLFVEFHSVLCESSVRQTFRFIIFVCQLTLGAYSIWVSLISKDKLLDWWGFRASILCCAILAELAAVFVEIGDTSSDLPRHDSR